MIFHENRLPADDSHALFALFVILKKKKNLKLSSAANYRWRFRVKHQGEKETALSRNYIITSNQ